MSKYSIISVILMMSLWIITLICKCVFGGEALIPVTFLIESLCISLNFLLVITNILEIAVILIIIKLVKNK